MWRVGARVFVSVVLIAGVANLVATTTGAARSWPLLTNVSLGTGTQIDSVDFVSPSLGYGIASNSYEGSSKHATEPFFLVRTTDQGSRWRLGPRIRFPRLRGGPIPSTTRGLRHALYWLRR